MKLWAHFTRILVKQKQWGTRTLPRVRDGVLPSTPLPSQYTHPAYDLLSKKHCVIVSLCCSRSKTADEFLRHWCYVPCECFVQRRTQLWRHSLWHRSLHLHVDVDDDADTASVSFTPHCARSVHDHPPSHRTRDGNGSSFMTHDPCDPSHSWPMTHDPWPWHHFILRMGLEGRGMVVLDNSLRFGRKRIGTLNLIKPAAMIIGLIEWVSSFSMSTKNTKIAS